MLVDSSGDADSGVDIRSPSDLCLHCIVSISDISVARRAGGIDAAAGDTDDSLPDDVLCCPAGLSLPHTATSGRTRTTFAAAAAANMCANVRRLYLSDCGVKSLLSFGS